MGDGVRHREYALKAESALGVGGKDSSVIGGGPSGVLYVVVAAGVGFPGGDCGVGDGDGWVDGGVEDAAGHEEWGSEGGGFGGGDGGAVG